MAKNIKASVSRIEADDGLYLEAKVYYTPAASKHPFDLGNVTSLGFTTDKGDSKDRESHQVDLPGALDTITRGGITRVELTFDTLRVDNLAMAVMGEKFDVEYTAENVSDDPIVIDELNRNTRLGYRHIDENTFEVKDSTDTPIDKAQYKLNPKMGYLLIKDGGTVNAGDTVKVSFSTLSKSGFLIEAGRVSSFKGRLELHCKNLVNSKEFFIDAGNVTMQTDGSGINWAGNEFQAATLKGTAAIVDGAKTPYTIEGEYMEVDNA